MIEKIIQFIKFGMVGISNTIISLIVYYILIYSGVYYIVANILAYFISSIWGYILNKKFVFINKSQKTLDSLIKYYIVYGSSFLLNILSMYILVEVWGATEIIAPILTVLITIPYNFILNKVWVFYKR